MPRRPHGGDDAGPGRGRGRPNVGSVRGGEDAVEGVAHAGRAGRGGGTAAGGQPDHFVTHMTGERGGVPAGHPTRPKPKDDAPTVRSIELENAGADALADAGYHVQQNPSPSEVAVARRDTGDTGKPDTNPDYLVEERVFDCYSPTNPTKSVRGIWFEVEEKVMERQQTQRMVVNLEDWRGDLSALRRQFADWNIPKLKELKVITPDGDIVQLDIKRDSD